MKSTLIELLKNDLNHMIDISESRRKRHEAKSVLLKLTAFIGAALVTVLLGVKSIQNNLLSDLTLMISVLVNILNGIEGFYNHRGLWIKDVKTLASLRELKRDFEFYITSMGEDDLSTKVLTEFKDRLQQICNDDIKTWSKIKEDQILLEAQEKSKGGSSISRN